MKHYLQQLAKGHEIGADEALRLFELLMHKNSSDERGEATDAQIGAYLFATSLREPTANELIAGARALRKYMVKVDLSSVLKGADLLDTCGTGGSGLHSFNTSTVVALVCAAVGQYVAKHGNRGASSASGSVDLLEALGANYQLEPEQVIECCRQTRFCFMFAPKHHPATANVGRIRKELGVRTIFNFLGPIANPAGANVQLLGVSRRSMMDKMAEALMSLGSKRAMIVNGNDGLDEVSLSCSSLVKEIRNGEMHSYVLNPLEYGFKLRTRAEVQVLSPEDSAKFTLSVLHGEESAYRDLVLLNSACALVVCGRVESITDGIQLAASAIDSKRAVHLLDQVIELTSSYAKG